MADLADTRGPLSRTERQALVVGARAQGLSWRAIEAIHGIKERTGRRDVDRWRSEQDGGPRDPERTLEDAIHFWERAISDLAELAERTSNDAVALGAIKARLDAAVGRLEPLRAVGQIPRSLAVWRSQIELLAIFEAFGELLGRPDVPVELLRDFRALVEWTSPPAPDRKALRDAA
jgi:hypothetical protein